MSDASAVFNATDFDRPLTACPLCKSSRLTRELEDFRGVRIDRCGECGVQFMNPQYSDAYLERLYARYNDPALDQPKTIPSGRDRLMGAKRDANIALVSRYVPAGRLLSIGTGAGDEIRAARARGWTVEGYDVDATATALVAERYGVKVYSGDLTTAGLPNDSFDCVYMDQVLEHPKDPGAYLRLAHRVLKRGGILYLGVPNIRSLSSAWKSLLDRWNLKSSRGRHYDTWHHLFYYSPASLRKLLTQYYHFDVILVEGDPIPDPDSGWRGRFLDALRSRFAVLDSSMRLLARPRR